MQHHGTDLQICIIQELYLAQTSLRLSLYSRSKIPKMKDDEAEEGLLYDENQVNKTTYLPHGRYRFASILIPWILTAFFFCTTVYLALSPHIPLFSRSSDHGNYEEGFQTDFCTPSFAFPMRSQLTCPDSSEPPIPIKIVKKHFTNDLLYNTTSGSLYNQPLSPNETSYIGTSNTSNAAWHSLLHAQYIALTPLESAQIPASHLSPIWYQGSHNFMELSVFHNLHCLHEIRNALSSPPQHQERNQDAAWMEGSVHLDHCIDQIRQALMCHADLTPVPMKPVEGGLADSILGNGEAHTCRDFDAIWEWVEERGRRWKAFGD